MFFIKCPAGNYMFKVNNINSVSIVNFEHVIAGWDVIVSPSYSFTFSQLCLFSVKWISFTCQDF